MQEILKKLISFKTTEDRPEEIEKGFEYIASLFDREKFQVQTFEKNGKYSLLVSFKGKDALRPKVLLNGHFDVVPAEDESQYQLRVEHGKAFGRGVHDMKGMVAVLIMVMQELGEWSTLPDVVLLFNGDEEIGGENGAGFMVKEMGLRPSFVLCGDGPYENILDITVKEKGGLWLELIAKGKAAHGAYLWEGENAVEKVIGAVRKIQQYVGEVVPNAWKSTANFGVIETSNKTPNKVPSEARAVLDIRFTEELARTPDEVLEKINLLVPEVEIRVLTKMPLLFVEEQNPFLQQFKKTAEEVVAREVPLVFSHGATDARYFGEIGIPAVVFGSKGGNMHAAREWVDLESLEKNREILLKFLDT